MVSTAPLSLFCWQNVLPVIITWSYGFKTDFLPIFGHVLTSIFDPWNPKSNQFIVLLMCTLPPNLKEVHSKHIVLARFWTDAITHVRMHTCMPGWAKRRQPENIMFSALKAGGSIKNSCKLLTFESRKRKKKVSCVSGEIHVSQCNVNILNVLFRFKYYDQIII